MMSSARAASIAAIVLVLIVDQRAVAARLLTVRIEVGGKEVQTFYYEDDGTPDKTTVWQYLGRDPLVVEACAITASADDPLRARLEGPVIIRVCHSRDTWIESKVVNLSLVRVRPDRDRWFLPAEELKRTALAAGLNWKDDPPPMDAQQFWIRALSIVAFVVMVFVVGYAVRKVRTHSPGA